MHLGINNECLYYASASNVKIADINSNIKEGQTLEIEIDESRITSYDIAAPNKLHGFFENAESKNEQYIMCLIETDDH